MSKIFVVTKVDAFDDNARPSIVKAFHDEEKAKSFIAVETEKQKADPNRQLFGKPMWTDYFDYDEVEIE